MGAWARTREGTASRVRAYNTVMTLRQRKMRALARRYTAPRKPNSRR